MSRMNHEFRRVAQNRLWHSFTVVISDVMIRAWNSSGYIAPVLVFILDPGRARLLRHLRLAYEPYPSELCDPIGFHKSELKRFLLGIRPHLRQLPKLRLVSFPHVYHDSIAIALNTRLTYADSQNETSFWQEHREIESLAFQHASCDYVKLVTKYNELPILKYFVSPSLLHTEIVINRPVLGISLWMPDEQSWDESTMSFLNASTGPLRALRLVNCEMYPRADLLVPFVASIETLTELELSQFAMPSNSDRAMTIGRFSQLPNLEVLSWNSTWEEKDLLWMEFDAVIASSSEAFPALRYVSFGAPMSSSPARCRVRNASDAAGNPVWAEWQPTRSCSWEVGDHLANLHLIIND